MGFIQRARLIEMQKRAAKAASGQNSNAPATPDVGEPPTRGEKAGAPAPARHSAALDYLGNATTFEGELRAQGDLKIDGEVEGVIHYQEGCLTIGAETRVEADLVVRDLAIAGLVEGSVDASGTVEIYAGGILHGDLRARRIHLQDGAVIIGKVDMGEDLIAVESAPIPKRAPAKATPKKPEAAA
ncbi:MAG: bactofilin family protein [Planctomycetota bacterium]